MTIQQYPSGHADIFITPAELAHIYEQLVGREFLLGQGIAPLIPIPSLRTVDGSAVIRFRLPQEQHDGVVPEPAVYGADMPRGGLEQ